MVNTKKRMKNPGHLPFGTSLATAWAFCMAEVPEAPGQAEDVPFAEEWWFNR